MNRRRSSIAASPVLLGAVAVLIGLVAVVLSYNANKGLPFIKTYDLEMNVKNAKKLTTGVDVRIGGKRVGQVNGIEAVKARDGQLRLCEMKPRVYEGFTITKLNRLFSIHDTFDAAVASFK